MKTITIVGVGALGSHAGLFLRSLKNVNIRVIDFDRVEQKNVASQFHSLKTKGRYKVDSFKQNMDFLFGLRVEPRFVRLTKDNVRELLVDSDLIVDCLDNGESRTIVKNFAEEAEIPCVHGAIDANGTCGMISWNEKFQVDFESTEGEATCEDGQHLPFIAQVSAALAQSVQSFLEQGKKLGFMVYPTNSIAI